jgi:hypothetical protein
MAAGESMTEAAESLGPAMSAIKIASMRSFLQIAWAIGPIEWPKASARPICSLSSSDKWE